MHEILKLIRAHQWIKNLFVFMPLFFAGQVTDPKLFIKAVIAFLAFSASASAIYIVNDLLDINEDRKHPTKKLRPLASGSLSMTSAITTMSLFGIAGISLIAATSLPALGVLGAYMMLNIGYSLHLKHVAIVDITIISIGFVLRLYVGATATATPLSTWIVIMTFLLALFLALAKRRDDISHFLNTGNKVRRVTDGYNLQLVDGAMLVMASVVIVAYILYTTSAAVVERLQTENAYLTALFVILGILRYLQIAFVESDSGSPTKIVLKDRFMQITILVWVLSFLWIIYL